MSLPGLAIRRPIGTVTLAVAVLVLGVVSFTQLAIDLMPDIEMPEVSVITRYEGVAPEEMETLVTRPIEQALSTIDGVEKLTSISSEGMSTVELEFDWGTNLDVATNDVRAKLDETRARLPENITPPVTHKFDLAAFPIAFLGLNGGGDERDLRYLADETLSRRLERVPGVASVQVRGGRVREIQIRLDATRLEALALPATEVSRALLLENRNVSGGEMLDTGREVLVRTVGEFEDLDEIRQTVVAVRGGQPIRVADIGTVADSFRRLTNQVWINGQPGIRLSVSKQSGANTVEVAAGLRREIARINADYRGQLRLSTIWDGSRFIKDSINNIETAALGGSLLAILVLLFFLRSVASTLVITTAIPLSILATFALMYGAGITLNTISLGGLALGVGMLVDNAIVILESIFRRRELGEERMSGATRGADEVASAIVASTTTTLAVFVPVVFLGGFVGLFFREMSIVVCFALICSLVVALTLVPTMAARLVHVGGREGSRGQRLFRLSERWLADVEARYSRLVGRALQHPAPVIAGSFLTLVLCLPLLLVIGVELVPQTDEGRIDVSADLAVGTPLETTMVAMRDLERRVRTAVRPEEVDSLMTIAGPGMSWSNGGSYQGSLRLNLVPVSARDRSVDEIESKVRRAVSGLPGTEIQVRKSSSNIIMRIVSGGGDRLSVDVRGHDLAIAARLSEEVRRRIVQVPGVTFARPDQERGQLERVVKVDHARLARLGLGGADVADTDEHYVLGKVTTRLRQRGNEFDIRVMLREADRRELTKLDGLPVATPGRGFVPLSSVATIERREGLTSIARENQERIIRVNAGFAGRPLSAVAADIEAALASLPVPDGFSVGLGGELEEQGKAFDRLFVGILLAIFLVFAVMAVQFESVRHPLVIMTAIPFAAVGVLLSLGLTGTTFNMNSFFGAIVLVGIVVNNAIVLVDYVNHLRRDEGRGLIEALAEGARRRLRPILMTTATTSLGMLPMALGIGDGGEVQAPLARVVIGGMLSSTLITLFFVPCLYLLIERRFAREER